MNSADAEHHAERIESILSMTNSQGLSLEQAKGVAQPICNQSIALLGPVASPMERRAGRYRAQLLVESRERGALQRFLQRWVSAVEALKAARRVRWSVDVDPQEML